MANKIPVDKIVLDPLLQGRVAGIDRRHLQDLIAAYESPLASEIPPLRVFEVPGRFGYLLSRGFHRFAAQKKLNYDTIECEVHKGTMHDAIIDSIQGNYAHGLKRKPADKRNDVKRVLALTPDASDREIARIANVSHTTVAAVRVDLHPGVDPPEIPDEEEAEEEPEATGKKDKYYDKLKEDKLTAIEGVYTPRFFKAKSGAEKAIDAHDNPMPDAIGDVFADPSLRKVLSEALAETKAVDTLSKRIKKVASSKDWPYVSLTAIEKQLEKFRSAIIEVSEHLREATPFIVCPHCSGSKCKKCDGSGYLSKGRYDVSPEYQKRKRA